MVYATYFILCRPKFCLAEVLIFSLMFSQALYMPLLSLKFSKAANLFEISIWYCFLSSSSFGFPRLNFFPSKSVLFVYLLLKVPKLLQPPDSDQHHSQLPRKTEHRVYLNAMPHPSICDQSGFKSSLQKMSRLIYESFSAGASYS